MNVIIVTIDECGNIKIDTNKVKSCNRNKCVQPIVKAIGNYSGARPVYFNRKKVIYKR
jgi:hypothetical protein